MSNQYFPSWGDLGAGLGIGQIFSDALSGTALRRAWGLAPAPRPTWTPPAVMTPAQAAYYLQLTEADVLYLVDQGELKARRIGGQLRIAKVTIDAWLAA